MAERNGARWGLVGAGFAVALLGMAAFIAALGQVGGWGVALGTWLLGGVGWGSLVNLAAGAALTGAHRAFVTDVYSAGEAPIPGVTGRIVAESAQAAGVDTVYVPRRVDLAAAWARLGSDVGVQGNLDPVALFAPPAEIRRRVALVLERAGGRAGHIFNLGHGVLPDTPVAHVAAMIDAVHELSRR